MEKSKKLNILGLILLFTTTLSWGTSFLIFKNTIENLIDDYKNNIADLQGTIEVLQGLPAKIKEAEHLFGAGNGGAKKMLVISETQTECIAKGLTIDKQAISDYTENILDTPQKK